MDTIDNIININHVKLNLDIKNKQEGLYSLAELGYENGVINNIKETYKDIELRENEFSTGFGDGFAIPHTKSNHVLKPAIFVMKPLNPVEWDSFDNKPVHVIIGILVPKQNENNLHLKLLSSLSKYLIEDDFKKSVIESKSQDNIYNIIKKALLEN